MEIRKKSTKHTGVPGVYASLAGRDAAAAIASTVQKAQNSFVNPNADGIAQPIIPAMDFNEYFIESVFYPQMPYNLVANLESDVRNQKQLLLMNRPNLSMQAQGAACSSENEGQAIVLSNKYLDPVMYSFTLRQCANDILYTNLTKMYNPGGSYRKLYENPLFVRLIKDITLVHALMEINRLWFLADNYNPAILTPAAVGGWANPTEDYFYKVTTKNIQGFYPRIFADVTIPRTTITQNALATEALQFSMTYSDAEAYMNAAFNSADLRLQIATDNYFLITKPIFDKLIEGSLTSLDKATGFLSDATLQVRNIDGGVTNFKQYYWRDIPIYVDYATTYNINTFFRVDSVTPGQKVQYLPNRVVFGSKANSTFGMDLQRLEQSVAGEFDYDVSTKNVLQEVATELAFEYAFSYLFAVAY